MTVEKLERVMWRLTSLRQDDVYTNQELEKAIMKEIGTNKRTYYMNRASLLTLKWIKPQGKKKIKITGAHLEE